MTLLTERASRAPARAAAEDAGSRSIMVEAQRRSGETILAMGMTGVLARRWNCVNDRYIAAVGRLSDVARSFGSVSKVLRLLLQSVILGLGAYLVLRVELTAGGMIAASIMMGRALAPIETAIANWRGFVAARQSIKRLSETLTRAAPAQAATTLPKPSRTLVVEHVTVVAPGATKPIVTGVRFGLKAGEVLGIIGPSGAGQDLCARWWASGGRPKAACGSTAPRSATGIGSCSVGTLVSSRRPWSCSTGRSRRTSHAWRLRRTLTPCCAPRGRPAPTT
jgi:ATP-binding cassette subfamily C protein